MVCGSCVQRIRQQMMNATWRTGQRVGSGRCDTCGTSTADLVSLQGRTTELRICRRCLVHLGAVHELRWQHSQRLPGLPFFVDRKACHRVPKSLIARLRVVPSALEGDELTVVCPTAELKNVKKIRAELAAQTGLRVMVVCFSVEDERELDFDAFLAAYPSQDPSPG